MTREDEGLTVSEVATRGNDEVPVPSPLVQPIGIDEGRLERCESLVDLPGLLHQLPARLAVPRPASAGLRLDLGHLDGEFECGGLDEGDGRVEGGEVDGEGGRGGGDGADFGRVVDELVGVR